MAAHDRRGFTLVEILISATIMAIVLLAIYLVQDASQLTAVRGQTQTNIQQNARVAVEEMAREIRMAGYGVPNVNCPGTLPVIGAANRTSITFRADLRTTTTALTAAAAIGATGLTVDSSTGLANLDTLYLTDGPNCEVATVSGAPGATTITLAAGTAKAYAIGSRVYRPKDVTFNVTGGQITRSEVNPGAAASPSALADKVPAQNVFIYYDAGNTDITGDAARMASPDANVRRIRITLNTTDTPPGPNDPRNYTVQSDVKLRNF